MGVELGEGRGGLVGVELGEGRVSGCVVGEGGKEAAPVSTV